jgi:hypothetical protein
VACWQQCLLLHSKIYCVGIGLCHSTFPSINLFYSGFILYTYQFVQSAFVPLRKAGRFVGVLNFNYLGKYLSSVINKNISDSSRYCYLIDTNSSALISHPKLTETAITSVVLRAFRPLSIRHSSRVFSSPSETVVYHPITFT